MIIKSVSSQHLTYNLNLLYEKKEINEEMSMDNQYKETFTVKGKVKINISNIKLIITDFYYIKEMKK